MGPRAVCPPTLMSADHGAVAGEPQPSRKRAKLPQKDGPPAQVPTLGERLAILCATTRPLTERERGLRVAILHMMPELLVMPRSAVDGWGLLRIAAMCTLTWLDAPTIDVDVARVIVTMFEKALTKVDLPTPLNGEVNTFLEQLKEYIDCELEGRPPSTGP